MPSVHWLLRHSHAPEHDWPFCRSAQTPFTHWLLGHWPSAAQGVQVPLRQRLLRHCGDPSHGSPLSVQTELTAQETTTGIDDDPPLLSPADDDMHSSGNWMHRGEMPPTLNVLDRDDPLCGGVLVEEELPGGMLVLEELPGGVLVREEFPDVRLPEDGRQRSGNWMQRGEMLLLVRGTLLCGGMLILDELPGGVLVLKELL